jgi:NDP-sugar pyrophosphorylase family protein
MADTTPEGMPRQAMILAAGAGTRLRPLTDDIPKGMVPVGGKPVLAYAIERLRAAGVTDIVMNLNYLPEKITDYFGDGSAWGVRLTYSYEAEALGTAGGVKKVADHFTGPFFVWYGDNLSTCDLGRMYDLHRRSAATATIALFHREDVTASGIVGLDEHDRITRFLEKPTLEQVFSNWVSAGILVLEPRVLDVVAPDAVSDFGRDVFPCLLARGDALSGYRMSDTEGLWWIDTLADLRRVETLWERGPRP